MEYTTNKINTDDICVIQFDMNDKNFDMDKVIKFADEYYAMFPRTSAVVLLPDYMTINPMDKETFRMFLDKAEEFYETLLD